jgi:hypothetical protein
VRLRSEVRGAAAGGIGDQRPRTVARTAFIAVVLFIRRPVALILADRAASPERIRP